MMGICAAGKAFIDSGTLYPPLDPCWQGKPKPRWGGSVLRQLQIMGMLGTNLGGCWVITTKLRPPPLALFLSSFSSSSILQLRYSHSFRLRFLCFFVSYLTFAFQTQPTFFFITSDTISKSQESRFLEPIWILTSRFLCELTATTSLFFTTTPFFNLLNVTFLRRRSIKAKHSLLYNYYRYRRKNLQIFWVKTRLFCKSRTFLRGRERGGGTSAVTETPTTTIFMASSLRPKAPYWGPYLRMGTLPLNLHLLHCLGRFVVLTIGCDVFSWTQFIAIFPGSLYEHQQTLQCKHISHSTR